MAKLVANNGETPVSRIDLQPGINIVGRAEGNHHVIPHASVSSRHCEIVVNEGSITVRDLGSTNGSFVDDKPIEQASLMHGQRLKLGNTEFVVEAPEVQAVPKTGALRVNVSKPATAVEETPPLVATGRTAAEAIAALTPANYEEPSFYSRIPGAFVYPFKKSGIILLTIGSLLFLVLQLISRVGSLFGLGMTVIATGYLFAYMQKIIAHSAQGEDEMPDFPDISDIWSDIVLPFLLFAGTIFVSFLPVIVAFSLRAKYPDTSFLIWLPLAATALAAFYWPMALLAVAVTDNFLALSPHVVLPSIVRVFLPYLVTFVLLSVLFGLRVAGGIVEDLVPLQQFVLKSLITVAMGFISLYLLTVEMRLLGVLFRAYRARLGWV